MNKDTELRCEQNSTLDYEIFLKEVGFEADMKTSNVDTVLQTVIQVGTLSLHLQSILILIM